MGLMIGGVSARDLILDSQSVSLYIGGSPPVKVWPVGPRTVTVTTASSPGGFVQSATGDTDLVGGWPPHQYMGQGVSFVAPVTCDRTVTAISTFQGIPAGSTIPAGTGVVPAGYAPAGTAFVFTEVL